MSESFEEMIDREIDEAAEESATPAIDKVMENQYNEDEGKHTPLEPELYFAAALEAYDLLGQTLSEAGSMYLLMGSMLGAITPSADTEVSA